MLIEIGGCGKLDVAALIPMVSESSIFQVCWQPLHVAPRPLLWEEIQQPPENHRSRRLLEPTDPWLQGVLVRMSYWEVSCHHRLVPSYWLRSWGGVVDFRPDNPCGGCLE